MKQNEIKQNTSQRIAFISAGFILFHFLCSVRGLSKTKFEI